MAENLYQVLGVERDATAVDIKRAYKKSALKYHPDRPSGDERMFKRVGQAYETLIDPEKRAQYNMTLGSEYKRNPTDPLRDCRSPKRQKRDAVDLVLLGADDESLWEIYAATPNFSQLSSFRMVLEAMDKFEAALGVYRQGRRAGDQRAFQVAATINNYASFAQALAEAYKRDTEVADREAKTKDVASRLLNQFSKNIQLQP